MTSVRYIDDGQGCVEGVPDDFDYEPGACLVCGGPSVLLGTLGRRDHYRCRNCGAEHSERAFDHPYHH